MISRIVLTGCLFVSTVGCSSDEPSAPPASMCLETADCMVEECSDEYHAFNGCLDATGDADQCDPQNLAHGRCLDECGYTDLPEAQRDAANARYLCEVQPGTGDCSEETMTCEASG
jgi:hypothetical protein